MGVNVYDPKSVVLAFGPILVSGYADGTFVIAERNEDNFVLMMGSDGEACRAKSNNKSGRVTVTLLQSSMTNDLLAAAAVIDERSTSGDGISPLLCKDNSGRGLFTAETAWIVKPATATYGREVENREWVFETNELIMFAGGN
jgi:hypothetical protein